MDKNETSPIAKKIELLKQVYEATKNTVFVGDENDAERYVGLFEKREALFAEIYKIDERMAKDGAPAPEAELNAVKSVIADIVKLDKENEPYAKQALNSLRDGIKGINMGKNLSFGYVQNLSAGEGIYFDAKN